MSGVMHHSSRYSHDEESSSEQAELALFGVLLDRFHKLIFGDFQLGICATRNLNHHVDSAFANRGISWNGETTFSVTAFSI
jgi:hypothetical protein